MAEVMLQTALIAVCHRCRSTFSASTEDGQGTAFLTLYNEIKEHAREHRYGQAGLIEQEIALMMDGIVTWVGDRCVVLGFASVQPPRPSGPGA